jgi:hypoxanthine phosphoribosyltransferase
MVVKEYVTYNQVISVCPDPAILRALHGYLLTALLRQVHRLCQESAPRILEEFKPQLMIAIGGGGYVPARILRSFLKQPGSPNIPIQAIGLSLYEKLPPQHEAAGDSDVETVGTKVTRTQWLDLTSLGEMKNLVGKRILIVDEVDDTRTTLEYAVKELEKDVEMARQQLGGQGEKTVFSIFVLHVSICCLLGEYSTDVQQQNKNKEKKGHLPEEMLDGNRYLAARTVGDVWICYPWEATDIEEHDAMAAKQITM